MKLLLLILTSFIFCFFFLLHGLNLYRTRRLPPGPLGFPIIGSLLELGPKPHESLAKLAHKHGPFMTIKLGTITSVIASTPDAAKDVLQRNDGACSGRTMPDVATALDHPEAGILWMPPDETWRAIRKALNIYLTNPKKLHSNMAIRHNVVQGALDFLRESARKRSVVDVGKLVFSVSLNQMSNTFISQNVINYNDSNSVERFKMAMDTVKKTHGKFNITDMFPLLKPFDPHNLRRQMKMAHHLFDDVVEVVLRERLKHRELKMQRYGDMLDSLLDYSQENKDKFSLIHVKSLIVDSFLAGADTSPRTTTWAMTEMLSNPDVYARVRKEVSEVVGEDGKVHEAKILDLPYLHAVIKETMRLHPPIPLLAPHKTMKEVKLGDFIIPTNTQILVNAWAVARDPNYWENPSVFMPGRFLGNKVDYKGQHFQFIPFGSGRRMCPGTPLAHRMVSLMVASFVYHFDWNLHHKMDMDGNLDLSTRFIATPIPRI
ncbi:putative geraniol 8-hydroxylase [Helianthus annuus]|nr:putative geraniol 8-hydroxylase [Helianthus annuus]